MAQQDWFNSARMDRDGYFRMNVRRDCVADDSLKQLRQAIGSGSGETMKKLRVKFEDEMAIDGGGPAKEWFLSLAQDLFHGDHGMFSCLHKTIHHCWTVTNIILQDFSSSILIRNTATSTRTITTLQRSTSSLEPSLA